MYKPMRFWGTGAGGPTPNPFCKCRVCENARQKGGKELRLRSAFRIDKKIMIDTGADFAAQAMRLEDDLHDIEHLLITHTHEDHFNHLALWLRRGPSLAPPKSPLTVYFTDDAYSFVDKFLYNTPAIGLTKEAKQLQPENITFKKLEFHNTYKINDIEVTPLRGNHPTTIEKNSANFFIKLADGKHMYYALDSGYYLDETFEYLKDKHLDILIGECTFTWRKPHDPPVSHMDIETCVKTLDKLYENKTIDEHTKIYLTHIEAKEMTHEELCEYFSKLDRKYKANVAYDGLSIE